MSDIVLPTLSQSFLYQSISTHNAFLASGNSQLKQQRSKQKLQTNHQTKFEDPSIHPTSVIRV